MPYDTQEPHNIKDDRGGTLMLRMMMAVRLLCLITSIGYAALGSQASDSERCERLNLKTPLIYTQDKAPRDLSGVVSYELPGGRL